MAATQFIYICILGSIVSVHLFQLHLDSMGPLENRGSKHIGENFNEKGKDALAQRVEMLENLVTTITKDNNYILMELNVFKERLEKADQVIEQLSAQILSTAIKSRNPVKDTAYEPENGYIAEMNTTNFKSSNNLRRQHSGDISTGESPKNRQNSVAVNRIQKKNMVFPQPHPRSIITDSYRGTPVVTVQKPAFHVYQQHAIGQLGSNQHLLFDGVVLNIGSIYNSRTGMVTCEIPGVYVFHHTLYVNSGHWVYADIVKNGQTIGWTIAIGTSQEGIGPVMAVTSLNKGDQVWVNAHNPTSGAVILQHKTAFSGFLN